MVTVEQIREFVTATDTWLEEQDSGEDYIYYDTRWNGDAGDEEYSPEDMAEAGRVGRLLKREFAEDIKVTRDYADEWVMLNVYINK